MTRRNYSYEQSSYNHNCTGRLYYTKSLTSSVYICLMQHAFLYPVPETPHFIHLKHESYQRNTSPRSFPVSVLLCKPSPLPSPHLHTLPRIQLRPHIEVETRPSSSATRPAGVKVNHVVDAGAAAVNDPVVAVEGRGVAEDGVYAGGGGHAFAFVGEGGEFGAAASV